MERDVFRQSTSFCDATDVGREIGLLPHQGKIQPDEGFNHKSRLKIFTLRPRREATFQVVRQIHSRHRGALVAPRETFISRNGRLVDISGG